MYPDGCTQFHIDYAAGGYEDKEDEFMDLTLAQSIAFLDSTDDYAWPAVKEELARLQAELTLMTRACADAEDTLSRMCADRGSF